MAVLIQFSISRFRRMALAALALLTAASVAPAFAQGEPPADPPGRVARLAEFQGAVWVYDFDRSEWTSAVRNLPLTSGARLATDPGARVELQVGSATLHVDENTELDVTQLDDDHFSLQLDTGRLMLRVRDAAETGSVEVRTHDGRFTLPRAGRYRVDRTPHSSFVTVLSGQARYDGPKSSLNIQAGQRAEFFIDANGVAQYGLTAPQIDGFSAWSNDRERALNRSASVRYASPAMTGVEELDRYGSWEQDPEYGSLWFPRAVPAGWAPYSTGHWAWVQPWGWTWVDEAPWGFAPFHYGRWVHLDRGWRWSPGARAPRPVYAPALVAWVGGPQLNVSISVGGGRPPAPSLGWFPLAPREVYVPSYRASPRYSRNMNITHVTNITHITQVVNNPQAPREFKNQHIPNALTVVPVSVVTRHEPVTPWRHQVERRGNEIRRVDVPPAFVKPPVVAPAIAAPIQRDDPRPSHPGGFRERGRNEPAQPRINRPEPPVMAPPAQPVVAPLSAPRPQSPEAPRVRPNPPAGESPRGNERRHDAPPPVVNAVPAPAAKPAPVPSPGAAPQLAVPAVPTAAPAVVQPNMRPQPVRRTEEHPPARPAAATPPAPQPVQPVVKAPAAPPPEGRAHVPTRQTTDQANEPTRDRRKLDVR